MERFLDRDFPARLQALKEGLLPYLKRKMQLLEESPTGPEVSPEPDSPKAYSPGDDVRYIDWGLYARLDKLYLKTMTREEEVPFVILLDSSESMWTPEPSKFVTALRVAAALSDIFLSLGHRLFIMPWSAGVTGRYGPYTGEQELQEVLSMLEDRRTGGTSDLKGTLGDILPADGSFRAAPVILSDFLFPLDYGSEIDHLASISLPLSALRILSRSEESYRPRGNLLLVDPEGGEEKSLHAGYRTSQLYREALQSHLDEVRDLFRQRGGLFHHALSTDSFESIVRAMLV